MKEIVINIFGLIILIWVSQIATIIGLFIFGLTSFISMSLTFLFFKPSEQAKERIMRRSEGRMKYWASAFRFLVAFPIVVVLFDLF